MTKWEITSLLVLVFALGIGVGGAWVSESERRYVRESTSGYQTVANSERECRAELDDKRRLIQNMRPASYYATPEGAVVYGRLLVLNSRDEGEMQP